MQEMEKLLLSCKFSFFAKTVLRIMHWSKDKLTSTPCHLPWSRHDVTEILLEPPLTLSLIRYFCSRRLNIYCQKIENLYNRMDNL